MFSKPFYDLCLLFTLLKCSQYTLKNSSLQEKGSSLPLFSNVNFVQLGLRRHALIFLAVFAFSPFLNLFGTGENFQANNPRSTLSQLTCPARREELTLALQGRVCACRRQRSGFVRSRRALLLPCLCLLVGAPCPVVRTLDTATWGPSLQKGLGLHQTPRQGPCLAPQPTSLRALEPVSWSITASYLS